MKGMGMRGMGSAPLALAGALLLAGSAEAQRAQGLEIGAGMGLTTNAVEALSDADCPAGRTWAAEGRLAWRFSRAVALEGSTALHWESGEDCVLDEAPLPAGFFERTVRDYSAGYPFTTSDVRLAFEPSTPTGSTWFRAFGGWGLMWGREVNYWLAGGGVVFGRRIKFILDAEWKWFDVPFDSITQSFQDGVLTSEQLTDTGEESHNTFTVKLGFRLRT